MAVTGDRFASSSGKKAYIVGILVLTVCLFINCWHTHLWGPDEPREAEIAREVFLTKNWVVPCFNGMPFIEKPPLYYDVSALIYSFSSHPGALRLFSAFLGFLMLAALYVFAERKCGKTIALLSCALCMSMPQFYRAAHWILLDIGVGAWITAGLGCYGIWSLRKNDDHSSGFAILFFLFAALAMLTKGIISIVYFGIIILPHWFFFRRKPLPPVWTLLFFLIPVGIWIYFFYREGGIYFLHEHFINNTIGRFLHHEFHLEGSPIIISDVGLESPFLFYFKRLPNMLGAAIVFLPFSVIWAWRTLGWKFFHLHLSEKVQRIVDLFTKPHAEAAQQEKDLLCFLMLWSFVPIFVFSLPAIKEVTYLLPSYAGVALFMICYVYDRFFRECECKLFWMRGLILPLLGFILTVQIAAKLSILLIIVCSVLIYIWLISELLRNIRCRNYSAAVLPILSALIGGVLLGNTPELMVRSRLDRKCYCQFSDKIWANVGSHQLYLKTKEESIRGALPYYGKRNIRILKDNDQFYDLYLTPGNCAFLLYEIEYEYFLKDPEFLLALPAYHVIFPGFPKKADTFVLLIPKAAF